VGQTFAASMAEPVTMVARPSFRRGEDVVVKLGGCQGIGKLTGRAADARLDVVKVDGRMVDINTQSVSREERFARPGTAKWPAGGRCWARFIGGIAGGGKGAVIGAGRRGRGGAGVEEVTKGQRVKVPSETRLTFVFGDAIRI